MVDYLHGPVQHDAFFRKYASKKFLKGMFHHHLVSTYIANTFQPPSSFASGQRSSPPCTFTTAIVTEARPLKSSRLKVHFFPRLLMAVLDGSLTQAPNDHLCLFSHMVSAFLELRQFSSQLAWRSRRSKRFSILDNAVILHQLHHVHTQQQDSPFTSSPVLLFSFFLPRTQPQTWTLFLDTMALMLLHCKILFQQHVATVKTYNGPLR